VAAAPPSEAAAEPAGDYATLLADAKGFIKKGQTKKAIEALEKATAANAAGDEALALLANIQMDRGATGKALDAANRAVAANANNADAYLVIGSVQQQLGRVSEAKSAYQSYLRLAPKGRYAQEIRSILSTLR
jgi:tetratricopeptide (TPR) repeat protein